MYTSLWLSTEDDDDNALPRNPSSIDTRLPPSSIEIRLPPSSSAIWNGAPKEKSSPELRRLSLATSTELLRLCPSLGVAGLMASEPWTDSVDRRRGLLVGSGRAEEIGELSFWRSRDSPYLVQG